MEAKKTYFVRATRIDDSWTVNVPALPEAVCISDTLEEASQNITDEIARVTGLEPDVFQIALFPSTSTTEAHVKALDLITAATVENIANDQDPIDDDDPELMIRAQLRLVLLHQMLADEVGRWGTMNELAQLASGLVRVLAEVQGEDPLEIIQNIRDLRAAESG